MNFQMAPSLPILGLRLWRILVGNFAIISLNACKFVPFGSLSLSLKKHDNLEPELVLKRSWSPNAFCGRTWELQYREAARAPGTLRG